MNNALRDCINYIVPIDPNGKFHNVDERRRTSAAGLRTFVNVADLWGLDEDARRRILCDMPEATYRGYLAEAQAEQDFALPIEVLEILALTINIYMLIGLGIREEEQRIAWLNSPNSHYFFGGDCPIDVIGNGKPNDLWGIKYYLHELVFR